MLEYWDAGMLEKVQAVSDTQHSNIPLFQHSITFLFSPALLSRMKLPVHFFQPRAVDVRIDLRRRDIGVT